MNAKKRKKAAAKAKRRRGVAEMTVALQTTNAKMPRPRVTEYNEITVVPSFASAREDCRRDH